MKTQKLLKLHKRAYNILEMINRAGERAKDAANWERKTRLNRMTYSSTTNEWYRERLAANLAIKERLQQYYADVLQRIIEPIIERMSNAKVIGDFTVEKSYNYF